MPKSHQINIYLGQINSSWEIFCDDHAELLTWDFSPNILLWTILNIEKLKELYS